MLSHLPLTAAVAAMGAAMVSLTEHAHDSRAPAAAGWVLCASAAVVLCATMRYRRACRPGPATAACTSRSPCARSSVAHLRENLAAKDITLDGRALRDLDTVSG